MDDARPPASPDPSRPGRLSAADAAALLAEGDRLLAAGDHLEAAVRYGRALESLLARPEATILVVVHEIPVRYALNAAEGSDDPDSPHHSIVNATPYLFGEERLIAAAGRLSTSVRGR